MDRATFLLMPQRKYKAFLPKDGASLDDRFKAQVNVGKKNKYQAPVDVTQEVVKTDQKATVGIIFRSEPKLFSKYAPTKPNTSHLAPLRRTPRGPPNIAP
jgi:hypothetical protein